MFILPSARAHAIRSEGSMCGGAYILTPRSLALNLVFGSGGHEKILKHTPISHGSDCFCSLRFLRRAVAGLDLKEIDAVAVAIASIYLIYRTKHIACFPRKRCPLYFHEPYDLSFAAQVANPI